MDYYDTRPPGMTRRTRKSNSLGCGCSCDCNYSKSRQGICKLVQICLIGLTWILIAASPYYRAIFVIGGETWPFHIVMLLTIVAWGVTLFFFIMFVIGYHHQYPNVAWPTWELYLNICLFIMVLIAACLEAANVWRWDMKSSMYQSVYSGSSGYNLNQYGLSPGMSFTQTLNFNQYCITRPRECQDYFNLMMGNNSYYTNHLFATVLLFFGLIAYAVSTYFAYKTWRAFKREMSRPGDEIKPTFWMKMQYRFQTTKDNAKNTMTKAFKRGDDDKDADLTDNDENDIDLTSNGKEKEANGLFLPKVKNAPPAYTSESDRKSYKSHRSHKSSSSRHHHRSDRSSHSHDRRSHRSHSAERPERKSHSSRPYSRSSSHDKRSSSSGKHRRDRDRHSNNHLDEVVAEKPPSYASSHKSTSKNSHTSEPMSQTYSMVV